MDALKSINYILAAQINYTSIDFPATYVNTLTGGSIIFQAIELLIAPVFRSKVCLDI